MKAKKGSLEKFLVEHPDVSFDEIGHMGAAYVSCRGKWAKSISEAYDHVHIKKCPWCLVWIKEQKKLEKLAMPSPEEVEKRLKEMDSRPLVF